LAGYDLLPGTTHPGETIYLQLHWVTQSRPSGNWTVYTHVVNGEDGAVLAGRDSRPGSGSLITTDWEAGWRVLDEYQIQLPADLPPGEYGLRIGLYQDNGSIIPIDGAGIELGALAVE
jgi:hypothetical protein